MQRWEVKIIYKIRVPHNKKETYHQWCLLGHRPILGTALNTKVFEGSYYGNATGRHTQFGFGYSWLTAGCNNTRCKAKLIVREDSILKQVNGEEWVKK